MTLGVRESALSAAMPDTSGLNFFDADPNLAFALAMRLPAADMNRALPVLAEAGTVAGGELDRLARLAEAHPPVLVQYNARGERVDEVRYHPAYTEMERLAFGRFALTALSHRPAPGWDRPAPHVFKYALSYVLIQSEFGLFCPVNMTDSLARVLRRFGDEELVSRYVPALTSTDETTLLQGAMFMTERSGGSDVGATETVAVWTEDGWRLHGDKWFCSNVSAGLI